MNNFWIGVKENHDPEALHEELTGIYKTALDLAVEAIQTAAMARKGIISSIDLRAVDQGGANYEPEKSDRSSTGRNGDHK